MALQIVNSGSSLRLVGDATEKWIQKNKVVSITVVRENSIRMDMPELLQTILFRYEDVTVPAAADASSLAELINTMITDCVCSKACDCGIR